MSREIAIEVKNITKTYSLYKNPVDRLKEQITKKKYSHDVQALKETNFKIYKGETFGIIGVNGSGKSTLLQILAGIIPQTSGDMVVNGKVAALLELGSGFNPEYTGRENIFINASILGMAQEDIESRLDEIVAFSEIGEFIDSPVKTYSSGMFLRLAFSVAINVEADILLIDEALAVGDIFFRQKCYKKLNELREKGVTIIFVSHAMGEVEQFCERSLLLSKGKTTFLGETREAVKKYYLMRQNEVKTINTQIDAQDEGSEEFFSEGVLIPEAEAFIDFSSTEQVSDGSAIAIRGAVTDEKGKFKRIFRMYDKAVFYYEFEALKDMAIPIGGIVLYNDKNVIVHGKNSLQYKDITVPSYLKKGEKICFSQEVYLDIQEGEYTFEIGLASLNKNIYQNMSALSYHEIDYATLRHCHIANVGSFSVVLDSNGEHGELLHHGITDLRGNMEMKKIVTEEA